MIRYVCGVYFKLYSFSNGQQQLTDIHLLPNSL
jgi:hypothetical protein